MNKILPSRARGLSIHSFCSIRPRQGLQHSSPQSTVASQTTRTKAMAMGSSDTFLFWSYVPSFYIRILTELLAVSLHLSEQISSNTEVEVKTHHQPEAQRSLQYQSRVVGAISALDSPLRAARSATLDVPAYIEITRKFSGALRQNTFHRGWEAL